MRCVFVVTSAYVGRLETATRVAFWAEEPTEHGFDPSQLITVDLSRTPNAAAAGVIPWDAVDVDDCVASPTGELGGTTIGPRWPEIQVTGVAQLEQSFIARLSPSLRPSNPPTMMGGHTYEYMNVLYWPQTSDPRAGKRYAGHYAEILEERGGLAYVRVFPPGSSDQDSARTSNMWIDLASPQQCDAGRDALTQIGVGGAPKHGALFLIAGEL
jgi:hypothetical protein